MVCSDLGISCGFCALPVVEIKYKTGKPKLEVRPSPVYHAAILFEILMLHQLHHEDKPGSSVLLDPQGPAVRIIS